MGDHDRRWKEGEAAAAHYSGREVELKWGIKGGGLGTRRDVLRTTRDAIEREIGMVVARPKLEKIEVMVRRRVPRDDEASKE